MTTKYQIIYWRDIPAQVKVKAERQRSGRPLSDLFQDAIDRAAMHAGKTDSDAYLAEWRNGEWQEREGAPEELLDALIAELETDYPIHRLQQIIQNGGWEAAGDAS